MIASILQGGVGNALASGQATRINNQNIRLAQLRRQEMQPLIDQLRTSGNYAPMEEQLVRDFSRASDQMAAQSAQTGMTNAGSGGLDQVRADLLGSMIASMAQVKAQDEAQRQQLLASILQDPTLFEGERPMGNVGLDALLGGIGGAFAGAGSILPSFLQTKEGVEVLRDAFGQSGARTSGIDASRPTVDAFGNAMATSSDQIRQLSGPGAFAQVSQPGASGMGRFGNFGNFLTSIFSMLNRSGYGSSGAPGRAPSSRFIIGGSPTP